MRTKEKKELLNQNTIPIAVRAREAHLPFVQSNPPLK